MLHLLPLGLLFLLVNRTLLHTYQTNISVYVVVKFPRNLAGLSCDSIDVIAENIQLAELEIGDLIVGLQMGAYTAATKARFNSLPDAKFVVWNVCTV